MFTFKKNLMQPVTRTQRLTPPAVRIDCLSTTILLAFLWGWHWRVTGSLPPAAGVSLVAFLGLCLAYGSIFTRLIASLFHGVPGLPMQFLTGYFVFNSLLFIIALVSPLGMAINLVLLAVVALVGVLALRKRILPQTDATSADRLAGCLTIVISCLGATIWSGDAQSNIVQDGNVIFRVWNDVYIHAREISVFSQAHGIASVQDIKLAGGRAPIYHFASYLSPAAISAMSGATAMQVYASLQLPLGIMLTGLAAYCFMGKLFGLGPGIAAVVAIILFPDAYQQGFQNRYLSYNFMAQVNLGMLYGIAAAAMAWMFMIEGCRRGRFGLLMLSYIFLVFCLFYKAHLFVANSYVLMMYPFVFFTPVRRAWRVGFGILATVVFCLVIAWSQTNPRVPTLRLDGSGIGPYVVLLLHFYDLGWLQEKFAQVFLQEKHGFAVQAMYAAVMLLLSTFGIWLAALAVTLVKTRRILPAVFWSFPIIVVANYLVMAMGLAMDNRQVGTPEELVNRPMVWAYFGVAAWTAAVGYRLLIGEGRPQGKAMPVAVVALLLCFGVTMSMAPNLQTFPRFPDTATFAKLGSTPGCLVRTADFVRANSPESDIVQDASSDPLFVFSALSERQLYVGKGLFGGASPEQKERLSAVNQVAAFSGAYDVAQFFADRHIDWFLQRPDTHLDWPQVSLPRPAFSCGGFNLFHFVRSVPAPASALSTATLLSTKGL